MKPYVIVVPEYVSNSAGIHGLYLLNEHLILHGPGSRVVVCGSPKWVPPTDDEITVYPDCFAGNYYNAKNVVRYLMMFAGYFGLHTDSDFPESEYMYYYTPEFCLSGRNPDNVLSIPMIKEDRFPYKHPSERSGSCCLAIKYNALVGPYFQNLPEDCIQMTKEMDLQELFSRVKKMYSYDNSAMNIEAALAGIEVEFRFNPRFEAPFSFGEYFDYKDIAGSYQKMKKLYWEKQLPEFIRRTQERFKENEEIR